MWYSSGMNKIGTTIAIATTVAGAAAGLTAGAAGTGAFYLL